MATLTRQSLLPILRRLMFILVDSCYFHVVAHLLVPDCTLTKSEFSLSHRRIGHFGQGLFGLLHGRLVARRNGFVPGLQCGLPVRSETDLSTPPPAALPAPPSAPKERSMVPTVEPARPFSTCLASSVAKPFPVSKRPPNSFLPTFNAPVPISLATLTPPPRC
jgi:hypothetical protein